MTVSRTIIAAIANKDAAVALSVLDGQVQYAFTAMAVEATALNPTAATYCFASGAVDGTDEEAYGILALYEAEPAKYFVSTSVGRQVQAALDAHTPPLKRFFA